MEVFKKVGMKLRTGNNCSRFGDVGLLFFLFATDSTRFKIMKHSILIIDAIINLILGIFLLVYAPELAKTTGIPVAYERFYPTILGSVLFGIGIALIIEITRKSSVSEGLGMAGAIVINLCGGIVLAAWLIFGDLRIPARGYLILWSLVIILIVVSLIELITRLKQTSKT